MDVVQAGQGIYKHAGGGRPRELSSLQHKMGEELRNLIAMIWSSKEKEH